MGRRRRAGRPVLGAFSGLVFGLFLGVDLWLFGLVRLDSALLTALPILGLLTGILLGVRAPFARGGRDPSVAADDRELLEGAR